MASLREIGPGVFQLRVLGAYVWLLPDEPVTLIDTGTRGSGRALLAALERLGRRPEELAVVVLTHYHPDHVGGLPDLLARLQARAGAMPRVAIHHAEAPYLRAPATLPNPVRPALLRALVQPLWPLVRLRRPCPVHAPLADGACVPGRPDLRVVHLPGHTPGSIALYLPARGVVLAGDALERRGGRLGPPNPYFTADPVTAWASLQRLAALEFDTLALSHWPPIRRGAAAAVRALVTGAEPLTPAG
ncbi:MAG TPA: MBL fold metallo-hydrolase [Chloroflexota bacterium]|nr:MBL fold metallo-hydrolase [Chloroflexota bacterium]